MKKPIDFSELSDEELKSRLEAIREARRSNTLAKRQTTKKKNERVGGSKYIADVSVDDVNM